MAQQVWVEVFGRHGQRAVIVVPWDPQSQGGWVHLYDGVIKVFPSHIQFRVGNGIRDSTIGVGQRSGIGLPVPTACHQVDGQRLVLEDGTVGQGQFNPAVIACDFIGKLFQFGANLEN